MRESFATLKEVVTMSFKDFSQNGSTFRAPQHQTKHDHLGELPVKTIGWFKGTLLVLALVAAAPFIGHAKIWVFDHPGLMLKVMAFTALGIALYRALGQVPASHLSQKLYPSYTGPGRWSW